MLKGVIAFACALAWCPLSARAQVQEMAPETLLQSNAMFAQGKRELEAGMVPAACTSFAESYRLVPRGGTLLNLGLCREQEGHYADAWRALRGALVVAQREGREDRVPLARQHLQLLESRLSFATLALPHDIDPSVIALRLDSGAIAREEWSGIPLEPGEHVFTAEAVGFEPWSTKVVIGDMPARLVVPIGPLVTNRAPTPPQTYLPSPDGPLQVNLGERVQRPKEDPEVRAMRIREQELALEGWFAELGVGAIMSQTSDHYIRTLHAFKYQENELTRAAMDLTLGRMFTRWFGLSLHYNRFDQREYLTNIDYPERGDKFRWHTQGATIGVRVRRPLLSHWLVVFADLNAGIAWTKSKLDYQVANAQDNSLTVASDDRRDRSLMLRATAGFDFGFTPHFGAWIVGGFAYAPTLTNLANETHDSGGPMFLTGVRVNSVQGWW